MIRRTSALAASSLALAGALSVLAAPPARACGGAFYPPMPAGATTESAAVVTDHRVAVAFTPSMTTLWDQVDYIGDPAEFAWVLPVRGGVTVGVGSDDFLTALDKETALEIVAPRRRCAAPRSDGCGGSNTAGCGASDEATSVDDEFGFGEGLQEDSGVFVTGRELVGPYAATTVHGEDSTAIVSFLRGNRFNVPTDVEPVLGKLVTEGFDFVVVRLRRKVGVSAMVPIRVSWKGYTPSLPLRMVRAGVSTKVGIKLFVIADSRYTTANYPAFAVDPEGLTWDYTAQKSDYTTIRDNMAASFDGRAFSVESSIDLPRAKLPHIPAYAVPDAGSTADDAASDASSDASTEVSDAAGDDAESDDAADGAAVDSAPKPEYDAGPAPAVDPYAPDVDLAFGKGTTSEIRRVTRLRAALPAKYLDQDLVLAIDENQAVLAKRLQVDRATSAPVCPGTASIAGGGSELPIRTSVAIVLGALGAVLARRASRR